MVNAMSHRRLLILLLLLLQQFGLCNARQRIVEGPTDVVSRLAETVVLKCRVENQEGAVQWLKNGFGLGSTRDLPLYRRYSMIGRSSFGEYHLQIVNATFEDEAQYECHIEETGTSASQTSAAGNLKIISEPEPPRFLSNQTKLSFKEGRNVELACRSSSGRPAAQLAWVILDDADSVNVLRWFGNASETLKHTNLRGGDKKTLDNSIIKDEQDVDSNGLSTITSRISFPVSKAEDQRWVACIATHPTYLSSYKVVSVPLEVLYAPTVEIRLDESRSSLEEGGQAVFTCHIEAKPMENLRIRWTKNDQQVEPAGPQTVILRNLRMEDHQHKVVCQAENDVGKGQASYKLNINYGPRIMTTSQTKAVQRGEPVTFVCEATGNPEPAIHWVRKTDSEQIIAKGTKLTIDSIQPWQVGEYDCVATVPGFSEAKMQNFLHLKGPPLIDFTDRFIKHENGKVTMTCQVRGKPFPKHISWLRDGRPINFDLSNGRIQAHEVHREFGMESKLTVLRPTESDFGIYNCSATNEFGSHSMAAELREPTLIERLTNYGVNPIAVLAGALILLMLLIFLICLRRQCCRSKKGTSFPDDPSDVTVRCEALDGVQFYGGDVYSTGELDNVDILASKDYISVPQNNPDLDYLPPPNVIYQATPSYARQMPHDYASSDNSIRYDQSFNSFVPNNHVGLSPDGSHVVDIYGNAYLKHPGRQLETLAEVATPDTESGTPLLVAGDLHDRAVSQMSTHV
uniref:Nephrin n=1 Tax=Panagrellus redivivus TaxID=6233 RepID=A0A7E4VM93_PANRE